MAPEIRSLVAYLGSYDGFFCVSAEEGARKLTKTMHIFTSPGKTEL